MSYNISKEEWVQAANQLRVLSTVSVLGSVCFAANIMLTESKIVKSVSLVASITFGVLSSDFICLAENMDSVASKYNSVWNQIKKSFYSSEEKLNECINDLFRGTLIFGAFKGLFHERAKEELKSYPFFTRTF